MTESIDWQALVQRLDNLNQIQASTDLDAAKRAIEVSLGEEHLQTAVDYCIQDKLGSELARSVLQQLRPWPAMQRCYELFRRVTVTRDVQQSSSCMLLLTVGYFRGSANF